jgi:hypothetical protein
MLREKWHLMIRLPCLLAYSACFLAILAGPQRADSEETSGRPEKSDKAESDSPARSPLGEIIQAGAKIVGKNSTADNRLPIELDAKGTSESSARKAAISALPLDQLSAENRQRVHTLLKSVSFYRRLPKVTFTVEPDVYNYFLAHPDVAVSIWRAMKISKLKMWQTGRFDYEADTGDGSVGTLEVLHMGGEKNLVVCDGLYKSQLITKSIEAKSLLFLQMSFAKQPDGTVQVTHRADLFVSFPSATIDVVARIFSPLTVKMTDRTFTEISLFLKMMSMAMSRRPDWVEHITEKMDGVAELRKEQVLELSTQVYTAAQNRELEQMGLIDKASVGPHEGGRSDPASQAPDASSERRSSSSAGSGTGNSENKGVSSSSAKPASRVISAEHRESEK